MKLLIDSNIILDALMNRERWASPAQQLLLKVAEEKVEGYITASTITDLYYILRKHYQDTGKTRNALRSLIKSVFILDVNSSDCEKAFTLDIADYEDALLVSCAYRHKMDHIVSRNLKDFPNSLISVVGAEEILSKIT